MDMMELDGLASVDALFGIAGLKEDLMDVGVLAATAGISTVAADWVFGKATFLPDMLYRGYGKGALAIVLGGALGIGAGRYINRGVGAGIAAGVGGYGIYTIAKEVFAKMGVLQGVGDMYLGDGGLNGGYANDYNPLPGQVRGLGQAGNIGARDLQPIPGQGSQGFAGVASVFT